MRISIALGFCLLAFPALAHDAPSGWSYPMSCCSNFDCREVPAADIGERPQGFIVNATGETIPYKDSRIRQSPDGEYHWCSTNGSHTGRTICLFVPPRDF
ncbi:hypothetical protein [Ensifer adhaerens]|uniref:hypothetical protein n=1 Tax=Ensifer adhaerens TaxID=106592 RepID=UPI001CBEB697|nr:hypothetical protein [Ensifer adhaerens]MBZ7927634.1 hypothetical protein [Ensifer adhaerens]